MKFSGLSLCALALSSVAALAGVARAEPALVEVCATCHGEDGSGVGLPYVPIIAGTPAAHLEEALYAYQDGARSCVGVPVMCETVAPLTETEISELAEYYSEMPRISSDEEFDARLAQIGQLIHDAHCARCHVMPDAEDVESAIGIPLNGQRSAYLRLALGAYLTGARETLVPKMAHEIAELDADDIEALVHYYASYAP